MTTESQPRGVLDGNAETKCESAEISDEQLGKQYSPSQSTIHLFDEELEKQYSPSQWTHRKFTPKEVVDNHVQVLGNLSKRLIPSFSISYAESGNITLDAISVLETLNFFLLSEQTSTSKFGPTL